MPFSAQEARAHVSRLDALVERLESLSDPPARELALETLQALLQLYGETLERILTRADERLRHQLLDDELIAHVLLIHGLHPADLASRVTQALDTVRPYLRSHGGDVELVGVNDGIAQLRLVGTCSSCPASTATLRGIVEDALQQAAPDLRGVETAEGAEHAG